MSIITKQYKYTTLMIAVTMLMLFSIWGIGNIFTGIVSLFLYTIFLSIALGKKYFSYFTTFFQLLYAGLLLWSGIAISQSILYWFFSFTNTTATISILLPTLFLLKTSKKIEIKISYTYLKEKLNAKCTSLHKSIWFIPPIGMVSILTTILMIRRSGDTLLSPWQLVGTKFFILLFIATLLLLIGLYKKSNQKYSLVAVYAWYAFTFFIGVIVYKYGFGFDPFIHQATETYIQKHGAITPKQPFYLGQYMLTLLIAAITKLPIHLIDILWVPLLATIFIPASLYLACKKFVTHSLPHANILLSILLVLLFPLNFFTQTTPNNLALVYAYITVLCLLMRHISHKTNLSYLPIGVFTATTIAIHPFIGLPMFIFVLGYFVCVEKKWHTRISLPLYALGLTGVVPAALWVNTLRGTHAVQVVNPLTRINQFLGLFKTPFWYWFDSAPLQWQLLYHYKGMLKPFLLCAAILGFILVRKKIETKMSQFILLSSICLVISAFLLATTFSFGNVIGYEQNVYADRLLELIVGILVIPGLMFFFLFMSSKKTTHHILMTPLIAFFLITSIYFTYPTRDKVSRYTGYNVRDADIHAVQSIAKRNDENHDYIVLTNQTVSAAAIKELGFAKYYQTDTEEFYLYSIPTGGIMYQYFLKMVYEEPKRIWMEQAMDIAGVSKAYFIHTNYWAPAAKIRDEAKKEANDWWEIDQGKAWVYEYVR